MIDIAQLNEYVTELVLSGKTMFILIPYFTLILSGEFVISRFTDKSWTNGEVIPNIASALGGVIVGTFTGSLFAYVYVLGYESFRIFTIPMTGFGFFLTFVLYEFVHYSQHRINHNVGFFWASHSVHHSSQEMNVSVGPRLMWGGGMLEVIMLLLLPFLGVPILLLGAVKFVARLYGMFTHTRMIPKLGFLEHILVTPSNHRVHHGTQPKYINKNYGQVTIIFDKLFGTHELESEEPKYGLTEQWNTKNPLNFQTKGWRLLFGQIRSAPKLSDKLRYLIMPPGWTHTSRSKIGEKIPQ